MGSDMLNILDFKELSFEIVFRREFVTSPDILTSIGIPESEANDIFRHLNGNYPVIYAKKKAIFSNLSLSAEPRNPKYLMELPEFIKYDSKFILLLSETAKKHGSLDKARLILSSKEFDEKATLNDIVRSIIQKDNIKSSATITDTFIDRCVKKYGREAIIVASFNPMARVYA